MDDFSIAFDFAGAIADDQELFFRMPVRWVRACAWSQNRHTRADSSQLIGGTVIVREDLAAFHSGARYVRQIQHAVAKFR